MDLDAPIEEAFASLPRILMAELGEGRMLELTEKEALLQRVPPPQVLVGEDHVRVSSPASAGRG